MILLCSKTTPLDITSEHWAELYEGLTRVAQEIFCLTQRYDSVLVDGHTTYVQLLLFWKQCTTQFDLFHTGVLS